MRRVSQEEKTFRTSISHQDLPSNLKQLNTDEINEKEKKGRLQNIGHEDGKQMSLTIITVCYHQRDSSLVQGGQNWVDTNAWDRAGSLRRIRWLVCTGQSTREKRDVQRENPKDPQRLSWSTAEYQYCGVLVLGVLISTPKWEHSTARDDSFGRIRGKISWGSHRMENKCLFSSVRLGNLVIQGVCMSSGNI